MSSKQVIILREDLSMRKGKMVAQGSPASLSEDSHNFPTNQDFKQNEFVKYRDI